MRWQAPCFVLVAMSDLARSTFPSDPLERMRDDIAGRDDRWTEIDATCCAMEDRDRLARLIQAASVRTSSAAPRSLSVLRQTGDAHNNDVVVAGCLPTCGRHYSLALLALVDALVAEPSGSPLATPLPVDHLRAAAFFVAAESVSQAPAAARIERSVLQVDRRLAGLRMPLRATGYLAARDLLRSALDRLASRGRSGGQ